MDSKKLYYTMGEVTEMFDVTPSLVRHWEGHFEVIKPKRNNKGNRLFTANDIENFKLIYHLVKERGMTLEGARRAMNTGGVMQATALERDTAIMERLQNLRSKLMELKHIVKDGGLVASNKGQIVIDDEMDDEMVEQSLEPMIEEGDDSILNISRARHDNDREPDATDKELFAFYEQRLF